MSIGALRLRGSGFAPMPRRVAVVSVLAGAAVVAFGVALLFLDAPPAPDIVQAPMATLTPIDNDTPIDARSDITGQVRSAGRSKQKEKGLEGVAVELTPLFERKGAEARKTQTDVKGGFEFEDVRIDLGSPYLLEAIYDGTRFPAPVIRTPRGSDPDIDIRVARTTKSDDDLSVEVESLTVVGDRTGLQAVHALTLRNRGKRAFVGRLELPLLRGAANIQESAGLDRRLLELEHGAMVSTKPVLPGTHRLTYTYVTQMSGDGIAFTREPQLPTERYELLVSGELAAVGHDGLRSAGDLTIEAGAEGDRTYRRSVATDIAPGDELGGRISADPSADLFRVGAPIAAALVALALFVFGLSRRQRSLPPEPGAVVEQPSDQV